MKKRKIDPRIIGLALLCLLVSAAAAVLVTFIQNSCTFADISNDLSRELDILCENYKRTLPVKQSSDEYNARFGEEFVQLISEILLQGGEDTFSDETLQQLCRDLEAENLVIIDEDGYVLYQAHTANADFTWDRFRQLRCSSGTRESAEGVRVITDEQAYLYYSCPLGSGKYVVLTASTEKLDKANEESFGWANLLHNAHIGIDGFTMVGSLQDYTVVWAEDEQLIGQNTFLTFHTIQDDERVNQNGILTISVSGREYYSMTRVIPDTTLMLMTCIPKSEVRALILPTVFFIILIFTLAAALIVSFCYIRSREKNISSVRILRRKMIPGTLVTAAVLIVLTFYLQTLNLLSTGMMQNENNVSGISNTIREYEIIQERITERSDYCTNSIAQTVAYALNRFPELISTDGLDGLADIIDCEEIRVFDADGRTAASSHGRDSLVLSTDPDSRSGEFRRLLQGVETYCQPAAPDDSGELYQIAGAALKDENGDNSGLVWIVIRPQQLISARTNWSYESVLENFAATGDTFAFAADKLDKVFTWFPSEYLIGKDALEYGLTDSNFRDSFNGFLMLDGTKYLGSCDENDTRCYFVVTSRADVYSKRLGNVLLNIAVIILMLLVLLLAAPQISAGDRTEDGRTAEKTLPGNTAAEPWKTSEKGRKTIAVLSNVFIIFTVVVSLLYIFRNSLLSKNSVIRFVFDARWEKGLNIFSLTACIITICTVAACMMLLGRLLNLLLKVLDQRLETVCRLFGSFLKILAVFVCFYFCLSFLGMNTSALLTSAGIMSVVVGLGANKLIADILAGLAIIFDGSIKVGDKIETGSCTGTVREIGIRSTKIVDFEHKLHIVTNSSLGTIANHSTPNFRLFVGIRVATGESPEKIGQLLDREREGILLRNPKIKDGPFMTGVSDVREKGYELGFMIYCDGVDAGAMRKTLWNELRMLFEKNGIKLEPEILTDRFKR